MLMYMLIPYGQWVYLSSFVLLKQVHEIKSDFAVTVSANTPGKMPETTPDEASHI